MGHWTNCRPMILGVVGPETVIVLATEFARHVLLARESYPMQHHFSFQNKVLGGVRWEIDMAGACNLRCYHTPLPLFGP